MRVLTACIAVATYPPSALRPGEAPLRYSVLGSRALHEHFRRIWPRNADHLTFFDGSASLEHVRAKIDHLVSRKRNRPDLFVLVFAGHGRAEKNQSPALCFFPDSNGNCEIDPHAIDELIGRVGATQTLLILDACHSGAFGAQLNAIRTLPDRATARIYLASSRADELSWEDAALERSLFVDGLLHALDRSSHPAHLTAVDAETGVFEFVSRHVATAAFHLARAAQQPLRGGTVQSPLLIPLGDARIGTAPQTPSRALRRRFVRAIAASAAAIIVSAFLSLIIAFHVAVGERQYVQLRPGPSFLSFLTDMLGLPPHVETSLVLEKLAPESGDLQGVRSNVREKRISGLWLGSGPSGLRRWGDQAITEWLNDEERMRHRVDLGFAGASAELATVKLPGFPEPKTGGALKLAGRALLLRGQDPVAPVVTTFLKRLDFRESCGSTEITAETATALEYLRDFRGRSHIDDLVELLFDGAIGEAQLASFALIRSALGFTRVEQLDREAGRRVRQPGAVSRGADQFDISIRHTRLLARAIAEQRALRGQPKLQTDERAFLVGELAKLESEPPLCKLHALVALAGFRNTEDQELLRGWLRKMDYSAKARLARLELSPTIRDAIMLVFTDTLEVQAFSESDVRHFLSWTTVESGIRDGGFGSSYRAGVAAPDAFREWLNLLQTILSHQKLPRQVATALVSGALRDSHPTHFGEGLRQVLADNVHRLDEEERRRLIEAVRTALGQTPSAWKAREARSLWSRLAFAGMLSAADIQQTILPNKDGEDEISSLRGTPFDEAAERAPVQTLRPGSNPTDAVFFARGLEALHKAAPNLVDARLVVLLEDLAEQSRRHWANERFVEGVAQIKFSPEIHKGAEHFALFVQRQISEAAGSADRRYVRAAAASFSLRRLSRAERLPFIDAIRRTWEREFEPQTKLALAAILVDAAKEQVTPGPGLDRLPE